MQREIVIGALIVAAVWLLKRPAGLATPVYQPYTIGYPDPSSPGQFNLPNVISFCTANPGDPLCSNTSYYGADVPGYTVCGTVSSAVPC